MKLKKLILENFRNFESLEIELNNTNVIFGMNDIGKTNLLYAIRVLLDPNIRKNGLIDSDYYNKRIENKINIILEIDITDEEDEDSKKIFAVAKSIMSNHSSLFISLSAIFNKESNFSDISMKWGGKEGELEELSLNQQFRCEADKIFNVIYIDSTVKLDNIFRNHVKNLFLKTPLDNVETQKLNKNIVDLNSTITDLNIIKQLESKLSVEYNEFRDENIKFSIQSEIEITNLYSNLNPYRLDANDEKYPTSGDGRKKLVQYSIQKIEAKVINESKVNIFLIEELENHLHRSLQKSLSFQLFQDKLFRNMFITTHSYLIVSEMNNVQLIKLFVESKVTGRSKYYIVPDDYKNNKQKFNTALSEAIFCNEVMLVEGQSEKVLFESILQKKNPKYECDGKYILSVEGVGFKDYYDILTSLGIKCIVKTDNDLIFNNDTHFIEVSGINRGMNLINSFPDIKVKCKKTKEEFEIIRKKVQLKIHQKYKDNIKKLEDNNIFISEIDLENDLFEVIPDKLDQWKQREFPRSSKIAVDKLQEAKRNNMISLCKYLLDEDIEKIIENENFKCLKRFLNE